MTRLQQKPILHGRDHLAGHPDPIPGMIFAPSGGYQTVVTSIPDLLAYWRLGETGSPWLDTSGVGTAANFTTQGSGAALTPNVAGALGSGDDGALELNYDGATQSGGRWASAHGTKDFDFTASTGQMSVAVWAKVKASAATRRGVVIGNTNFGVSGGYLNGWGLQVMYPSRKIRFSRGQPGASSGSPELYVETAAGVVAGDWNLLVGTYDQAKIRLYVNGVLVGETTDTSGAWTIGGGVVLLGVGYTGAATSTDSAFFYGTADEAAVWTRALTQAEINGLYNSGASGAGAGQTLITDGAGGTTWDFPLEVTF